MRKFKIIVAAALLSAACSVTPEAAIDALPPVFPDYVGVTVPCNIAPLNFRLDCEAEGSILILSDGAEEIRVKGPEFDIPLKRWRELTSRGAGISATVLARQDGVWKSYLPFTIHVSSDSIDSHLVYRLIEPGYETWNKLGIYQRCLEDFTEKPVVTNEGTDRNCMNCHSFAGRNPDRMVFHMRAAHGGTFVTDGKAIEKLNTKTPQTISAVVYPQWNNAGTRIAFSVNDILQVFHSTNPNRIEVYDKASDVVVYNTSDHSLSSSPLLMQEDVLETFPSFSPDGKTLYFCSCPVQDVPKDYAKIRYSICSIAYDEAKGTFGDKVDTLFNARIEEGGATFPRVSPDGRYLMFARGPYGCFNIWHKSADLWMIDLLDGRTFPLEGANSAEAESYHAWSGNGRWVVMGSRRLDGLYTRPFICHMDDDGNASKPFLLPQKDSRFYDRCFKSFNIPEFTTGEVSISEKEIDACALEDAGTDLRFVN